MSRGKRWILGSIVVVFAGLACAPVASAQYDDPPPYCSKPKVGFASDNDGMEKYASVSGIFRIDFDAKVEKCGNKTRVLYHVYWDATALQGGNHILAHTSSVRSSDNRRQTACVKKGGCTFQLDSGTESTCCYRPRVQYRTTAGRSYIKSARMDFAVEECGAGCNLRSLPYKKDFKVKYR